MTRGDENVGGGTKLGPLSSRYGMARLSESRHIRSACSLHSTGSATMKKTFRALPLVALLAVASGNALASSPSDVTRYDCKLPESSRPAGGARTLVYASPELVKSVVLDYGHYAGYIKPFDKSRVVGKSGDKTDVYLEV